MICKYFLLFHGLSFHFVGSFLCCAEAFYFDVGPLVYFLVFLAFVLASYPETSFPRSTSKELTTVFPCRQRILCKTSTAETWGLNLLLLSEWKDRNHGQCDLLFGSHPGSPPATPSAAPAARAHCPVTPGPTLAGLTAGPPTENCSPVPWAD